MTEEKQNEKVWALVELFGHQKIVGEVSEHTLGGTFIRVDVPAVNGFSAFTALYGPSAIYAIKCIDRDVAFAMVEKLRVRPVQSYELADITKDQVRKRLEHKEMSDDDFF